MTAKAWRVLIIDDNPEMTADAERELRDAFQEDPQFVVVVQVENDFAAGLQLVKSGACDIVILDLRRGAVGSAGEDRERGRNVFGEICQVRFIPVIFWTALPQDVQDLKAPPLVDVYAKEELDQVPAAVRSAIETGTAQVVAEIEDNVAKVMRNHLWKELAPHWGEDIGGEQPRELAHLLITRVAHSLHEQALPELTSRPSHCYLYPPVSDRHRPGDIIRWTQAGGNQWWVILTPACDLEHDGKVEFVLLGKASPLTSDPKYIAWKESQSNGKWKHLQSLLEGKVARYYYVPKFRDIPDLILDLENTQSVPFGDLDAYKRTASLVSPYSEALLAKYSHFRGRIGTPDLNSASIKERLSADGTAQSI
jgi:CheY-like chemotaxis protein